MAQMTGDPFFISGELTKIAYAKFNGFLNVGYILNGFKVLDGTVTLLNTVPRL